MNDPGGRIQAVMDVIEACAKVLLFIVAVALLTLMAWR